MVLSQRWMLVSDNIICMETIHDDEISFQGKAWLSCLGMTRQDTGDTKVSFYNRDKLGYSCISENVQKHNSLPITYNCIVELLLQ